MREYIIWVVSQTTFEYYNSFFILLWLSFSSWATNKCIRYIMIICINNSPNDITDNVLAQSLHGYSSYIKQYFLGIYAFNCSVQKIYICRNQAGVRVDLVCFV